MGEGIYVFDSSGEVNYLSSLPHFFNRRAVKIPSAKGESRRSICRGGQTRRPDRRKSPGHVPRRPYKKTPKRVGESRRSMCRRGQTRNSKEGRRKSPVHVPRRPNEKIPKKVGESRRNICRRGQKGKSRRGLAKVAGACAEEAKRENPKEGRLKSPELGPRNKGGFSTRVGEWRRSMRRRSRNGEATLMEVASK